MPTDIGPHLLGRVPSPPDARDFQLGDFLAATPLDVALAKLLASRSVAQGTKDFGASIVAYLEGVVPPTPPAPVPVPPPAPTGKVWADPAAVLDQGNTPHCVGFGWADWGNTDPVNDGYADADGHAIYAECKVIDGEPGAQDGSAVRSGAKAMQNRGRLSAYAFAGTVDEIRAWLDAKGSVVAGTDWTADMFSPDANGYVAPSGAVKGGHCYLINGDLPDEQALQFLNSWGDWGPLHGAFKMKYTDFAKLLAGNGEACAALELAR